MKVTRDIDCSCTAYARLSEDGEFVVSLRGQAPYSEDGMATAELPIDEKAAGAVRDALQALLESHHDDLSRAVDQAAMLEWSRAAGRGQVHPVPAARRARKDEA